MSDTFGICTCGHSEADHADDNIEGCELCGCTQMTPTAQEVAEQFMASMHCPHVYDARLAFPKKSCVKCLEQLLVSFISDCERAVWEEAAQVIEHWVNGAGPLRQQLAEEFRRRATAVGKEVP